MLLHPRLPLLASKVLLLLACLCITSPASAAPTTQKHWFHTSYLIDWAVALGVGTGSAVAFELLPPIEHDWDPTSLSLAQEITTDTFSWPVILGISAGVPLLVAGLAQLHFQSWHNFHHAALGLSQSMAIALFVSGGLNVLVGKLRPDWRDRCIPRIDTLECTGDESQVIGGRRSFPSRQTTLAFAGATFLSLYLIDALKLSSGALWKVPLALLPIVAATTLGVTRAITHRNHWEDVLAGALIGGLSAWIGYHLYFSRSGPTTRVQTPRTRLTILPHISPQSVGAQIHVIW